MKKVKEYKCLAHLLYDKKKQFERVSKKVGLRHGLVEERLKMFISQHFKSSLPLLINDMIILSYDYLTI